MEGRFCPRAKSSLHATKSFLLSLSLQKQKKMAHLTLEQRYKIEALIDAGKGVSEISIYLGRNKSVISREIKRNSDQRNGVYKAKLADKKAAQRHREKRKLCTLTEPIAARIEMLLSQGLSPEQIVGRSVLEGFEMVSTETIYIYIWRDKRKGGKLYKQLRNKGKKYRKRGSLKDNRGLIVGRIDIDKRPAIVEAKERLGDLEVDLVIGKNHNKALLTINDRATGMLYMDLVNTKEAKEVAAKIIELLQDWKPLIHTITSDNGKEFANHLEVAQILDIDYYFAKPYHSWERGANENLNGLIRQYFPKNYNFDLITKTRIKEVINILNTRPRKRLGYKTPNEIYSEKLDLLNDVAFMS